MTARTHDQVFQSWYSSKPQTSWKQHLAEENAALLQKYERLGFRTIPLAEKSKRPIPGFDWVEDVASWYFLFAHVSGKGNVGIVAGISRPRLVILDYDEEILPPKVELAAKNTLVSVSPNGYHIFTSGFYKPNTFDSLKAAYPKFDLARAGNGYCVVPPSMTCKNEHSKHPCEEEGKPHEYRMHEWLDLNKPIMSFSEFVRKCLTH